MGNHWDKVKREAMRKRGFEYARHSSHEAQAIARALDPPSSPPKPHVPKAELRDTADDAVARFIASGGHIRRV